MGFYLVPYCQSSPPTRFLLITAIGMCHFLPVHHFGMACLAGSKVNIQQVVIQAQVHGAPVKIVQANKVLLSLFTNYYPTLTILSIAQYCWGL